MGSALSGVLEVAVLPNVVGFPRIHESWVAVRWLVNRRSGPPDRDVERVTGHTRIPPGRRCTPRASTRGVP